MRTSEERMADIIFIDILLHVTKKDPQPAKQLAVLNVVQKRLREEVLDGIERGTIVPTDSKASIEQLEDQIDEETKKLFQKAKALGLGPEETASATLAAMIDVATARSPEETLARYIEIRTCLNVVTTILTQLGHADIVKEIVESSEGLEASLEPWRMDARLMAKALTSGSIVHSGTA